MRWQALLKADAKYTATGTLGAALSSYTRLASERLRGRLLDLAERSGPRTVLLAHDAGLIARYWKVGGRELMTALQQSARRHAARAVAAGPLGGRTRGPRRRWTAGPWRWWTG
ncbi:hypothetical protein [Streptomyces sp. NPDC127039]|uniref:hypothetical protein n=1 Tax=Streptomyces sp. NPDC127039 TaxID=3347115 RepID=UPI0036566292